MKYIILVLIVVTGFLYFRGTKAIFTKQNVKCQWHVVYAYCEGKQPAQPTFLDAIKAGSKF